METIKYLSSPIFTLTDLRFTTAESFFPFSRRRRTQFRLPHLPPKQLQLAPSRLGVNSSSATSSILVLPSEGPATSGNYSEFFIMGFVLNSFYSIKTQTFVSFQNCFLFFCRSLLLFIYLIANFIVPEMIAKSLKSTNEDGNGEE